MRLSFYGAAGEVTGSCYLLETANSKILLECGLIQGSAKDEQRNYEAFHFDVNSLDAVVLSHSHIDHSGRIPYLIKSGYGGLVYTHRACRDLCEIMLKDSGGLQEKDAEWENRKRERKGLKPVEPLYTAQDAEKAMSSFRELSYEEKFSLTADIDLILHDAGHILGSSIVELIINENGNTTKLVFSGDLGQSGIPILRDPTFIESADVVLLESTYGDRCHKDLDSTFCEIGEVFESIGNNSGNILIPAFAVGRTQEILYFFARHYEEWGLDRWKIFLDSPLAINASEVYERHYREYDKEAAAFYGKAGFKECLPNLIYTRSPEDSMRLNQIHSGAIIIAGSGMCTGGRIKHHLKHNVWRNQTHVMIVGYQAHGTVGRALVDGASYIRLWGETIRVAAKVHTIGGLSAHADQKDLVHWLGQIKNVPDVYLVHGEQTGLQGLKQAIESQYTHKVTIAEPGMQITL